MTKISIFVMVTALALTNSVAQAGALNPLAQVSQDWASDWQTKNLDAVLSLYTDDAVFLDADGSQIAGKPALSKFFKSVLAMYSAEPIMHSTDNAAVGDLGYDSGDYSETVRPVRENGSAIRTHGSYLVILRHVTGHWLIVKQMWTGNVPVPVKK